MTDSNSAFPIPIEYQVYLGEEPKPNIDMEVPLVPVKTESDFNGIKADLIKFDRESLEILKKRDKQYSEILGCYYDYVKKILDKNPSRQEWFFKISLAILIISPIQLILLIWFGNTENLAVLLASAGEMISALIVFPKIIAEYLFNTNETTNINDVATAIQNYDVAVRKGIRHTVEGSSETETQDT